MSGKAFAFGLLSVALGCGAARQPVVSDDATPVADGGRCRYLGKTDRIATEARAPGAPSPNVRRVYAVVKDGEQSRRVLRCREVDTNFDGRKDVVRRYDPEGRPATEASDSNYDGRLDTWVRFRQGRISEVEVDRNADGKPDELRRFSEGRLARIRRDTNDDGRPDQFELYSDGSLERIGVDADGDGRVDRWHRRADPADGEASDSKE